MHWREEAQRAKAAVIDELRRIGTPVMPRLVIAALTQQGQRPTAVKRAIWYLMDDHRIRWNRDRTIQLEIP